MVLCPPPPRKKGTVIFSLARKMHLTNMDFQIFLGEEPRLCSPPPPTALLAFAARNLFQGVTPLPPI